VLIAVPTVPANIRTSSQDGINGLINAFVVFIVQQLADANKK